ncbi:MAG: hypothetical protein H6656_08680 [Ardenticatenaceae bacterium]|nr:hypothetical protein [Ardenticatenaceae bacterium]
MQPDLLDILLFLFGGYYLVSVIFKPAIFWKSGRIVRTRDIMGDQKTLIMYGALGVLMIGLGVWFSLT